MRDAQVTIIGLGLMGGSLGLALRRRRACRQVWGVARRPASVRKALEMGAIDSGTLDLAEGVADADIVVLATPVRTIIELIPRLGPLLAANCLLTDVGSTKAAIVEAMEDLPPHVQPLGGHPMCGKEAAGLEAAEANLYEGAVWALTPLSRTSPRAREMGQALARAVGARPLVLDPQRHDRLVAAISHLPYLLAVALVGLAEEVAAEDELLWTLAASGFRDTSRLAASEATMMLDILLTNRGHVAEMIQRFGQRLEGLAALLEGRDQGRLRQLLERARQRRGGMFR
ncbi:MAG: prephenate dehydrogenase [Anaerolineae bacterium]